MLSRLFRRGRIAFPRVTVALLLATCTVSAQMLASSISSLAAGQGATPVPQTVRVALSGASASNAGLYIAHALGYFASQGLNVEFPNFGESASAIAPALATNRVDVADVGINPAMFNTVQAGDFKVVADKGSLPRGFGYVSIVVRKDLAEQIKGPADLKGLSIAMTPPGLGTANGFALDVYLARAHLTPQDVHIQPILFPVQLAALTNKAVSVAIMTEPFATQAVQNQIGVRLITLDEIVPDQQVGAIAYGSKFVAAHRDLAEKFMLAYVQGIRVYNAAFRRGVNKEQVIQILTKETPIKDPQLWATMIPAGLNPTGRLNVQSIQQIEDFFHRIGLVAEPPPLSTFIDNSFVDYANKVLGPVQ